MPERLARDRELIPFDQALVVGFADSDDFAGGKGRPSFRRRSFPHAISDGLAKAGAATVRSRPRSAWATILTRWARA